MTEQRGRRLCASPLTPASNKARRRGGGGGRLSLAHKFISKATGRMKRSSVGEEPTKLECDYRRMCIFL